MIRTIFYGCCYNSCKLTFPSSACKVFTLDRSCSKAACRPVTWRKSREMYKRALLYFGYDSFFREKKTKQATDNMLCFFTICRHSPEA
ncbi:hypothetical protein GDO78_006943 [Eleutherodactylus coqui]|uniref:Uncharacterized protein n=1 Tax=Eleutherodactylus coqui TaxID=57060 RepID=A0A8J6FHM0_ELECQ|nr:hypothetical protein GDO78_006943 [Eleutherodactylus coqui]